MHQINGKDSKTVNASESRKKNPIDVMAGAGVEFYSIDENENHISPIANLAIDFYTARNKQTIGLRLQLTYLPIKYETTVTGISNSKVVRSFSQENLIPEIDLFFIAVNRKSFKLYGGFGFGFNFALQLPF